MNSEKRVACTHTKKRRDLFYGKPYRKKISTARSRIEHDNFVKLIDILLRMFTLDIILYMFSDKIAIHVSKKYILEKSEKFRNF